jgi:hypothetical protein
VVVPTFGADRESEGGEHRLVLAGFYELGRRHGGADQDPGPADRVLKTEGIGDGDVEHPADASERVEALEVIGDGDGLLAPAAQTTEAAGLDR